MPRMKKKSHNLRSREEKAKRRERKANECKDKVAMLAKAEPIETEFVEHSRSGAYRRESELDTVSIQKDDKTRKKHLSSSATVEHRDVRLLQIKKCSQKSFADETPAQNIARLRSMKTHTCHVRSNETSLERRQRLQKDIERMRWKLMNENIDQSAKRRCSENAKKKESRKVKQTIIPTIDSLIARFHDTVKTGTCSEMCTCCHRLQFKTSLSLFKDNAYPKISNELLHKIQQYGKTLSQDPSKEFICTTCHTTLKSGKMPCQAVCNNLMLTPQPLELNDLNPLEVRLIAQRIPFMKLVALPRGRQQGIQGPAVNVPSKLDVVCEQLPRLPSELQILPMRLKRKLAYKSYYMREFVRPQKVLAALAWLKANNALYQDINLVKEWSQACHADDPELWTAMTIMPDSHTDPITEYCLFDDSDNLGSNDVEVGNVEPLDMFDDALFWMRQQSEPFSETSEGDSNLAPASNNDDTDIAMRQFQQLASEKNMTIVNVKADGDCLYAAVLIFLEQFGIYQGTTKGLRSKLAHFLRNDEKCKDFMESLAIPDESNINGARGVLNNDMDVLNDNLRAVSRIDDIATRQMAHWLLYVDELEHTAKFGDHIAVQGLAEMFDLRIEVLKSDIGNRIVVQPANKEGTHTIHLGLIEQWHYVALKETSYDHARLLSSDIEKHSDKYVCENHDINSTVIESDVDRSTEGEGVTDGTSDTGPNNDVNEKEEVEDEIACEHACELSGLPYDSSVVRVDPDYSDKELSLAPAENEKPVAFFTDLHFEELSNPEKYPDAKNALFAERERKIDVRRYFNQRLLNVDGRFARSIDYLLSAQYATEAKTIQGSINTFIFRRTKERQQQGDRLTAGIVKDAENLRRLVHTDKAFTVFKKIRGSPAYWQAMFHDLCAMIRQLGLPTWFLTISSAEMRWPDIIQAIARQYGTILDDDAVKALTWDEKCRWLRSNPVTAARQFQYRLETLFKDVILSNANPLGSVTEYAYRIEFQARGSPHAHCLLFVQDAPKFDAGNDQEVTDFIDKYVSCSKASDDAVLSDVVSVVQNHTHSSYCRKKGSCRFGYPKPPSNKTIVARESVAELCTETAKNTLGKVYAALNDVEDPETVSLEELLVKAEVNSDEYHEALSVSEKRTTVVLKRKPNETCTNQYSPTLLKCFQSNMDLQYITDPYSCVMYLASYVTKDERGMSELLKRVTKESADLDIREQLQKLGQTFLTHRELSAQEAAYRLLQIPMKRLSRQVIYIDTNDKQHRTVILKPWKLLEGKDEDDEDIFLNSLVQRYVARPDNIAWMCLATFVAHYAPKYNSKGDDVEDSVPIVLNTADDNDADDDIEIPNLLPEKIHLKDGKGKMHKRRRVAVLRFPRYNEETDRENFCRAKLMLYYPWVNEDIDLQGGYESFEEHYYTVAEEIAQNESLYTQNAAIDVDNAMDANQQYGNPEHAWDNVAPSTEHDRLIDEAEGNLTERDLEHNASDNIAGELVTGVGSRAEQLGPMHETSIDKQALPIGTYRQMMRSLNPKQRQIVLYHRMWCKSAVIALKENRRVEPYRIFLSGPGGVGKSHVIQLIYSDTRRLLGQVGYIRPTDMLTLLSAPTGVAAFNIGGSTIHSALLLRQMEFGGLTGQKLQVLQNKFENLHLLIIDEISMVGSDMLLNIHKRLCEIKKTKTEDAWFGNVNVLAAGDLFQLPPVKQSPIYKSASGLACMGPIVFKEKFVVHELNQVMRQRDDQSFAELLCRLRKGDHTLEDVATLRSREISIEDPCYPEYALHVFAFNKDVNSHNLAKLDAIPAQTERIQIYAIDNKRDVTNQIDLTVRTPTRQETGNLETVLTLAIGARVMMTVNVDTGDGLVNGVMGEVKYLVRNEAGKVMRILVKFDIERVGRNAIAHSMWKTTYPDCVPVSRHEARYEKKGKRMGISRVQFPLTLSFATTIHKCQGLTMDKIVVDMKHATKFGKGQAYVAFSRVKTLSGLFITNFDERGIKHQDEINDVMNELTKNTLPSIEVPRFLTLDHTQWLTVGHLNVRYFLEKLNDLTSDSEQEVLARTDVMCFSETYLTSDHNISRYASFSYDAYETFRQDIPNMDDHAGKHGVMVCAAARLNPQQLHTVQVYGLESLVVSFETASLSMEKMCVAVVYRPPTLAMKDFLPRLHQLLSLMPKIPSLVIGDFNENLRGVHNRQLGELMSNNGFVKQLVDKPTHDSGSLIDHAYTNINDRETIVDVRDVYYSDHDAVHVSIEL